MSTYDQWQASIQAVTAILKARFPNLGVAETLKLAGDCVKAVLAAHESSGKGVDR